jgi:hypothetical protein
MNDKNTENELKNLPLRAPSERLDANMRCLFLGAAAQRPGFLRRPVALWQCLAACLLFAVGGFLARQAAAPQETPEPRVMHTYYVFTGGAPGGGNVFDTAGMNTGGRMKVRIIDNVPFPPDGAGISVQPLIPDTAPTSEGKVL